MVMGHVSVYEGAVQVGGGARVAVVSGVDLPRVGSEERGGSCDIGGRGIRWAHLSWITDFFSLTL